MTTPAVSAKQVSSSSSAMAASTLSLRRYLSSGGAVDVGASGPPGVAAMPMRRNCTQQ